MRRYTYQHATDDAGNKHVIMHYHLRGSDKSGMVMLDAVPMDDGTLHYRFLLVDTPGYGLPSKRILLEREDKHTDIYG
jgi:hypothetical protein